MTMFQCWLPGETERREIYAGSPPDAAETFATALQVLHVEDDEIDVYVGVSHGNADAFRVRLLGGDVVAEFIGQRIRKVAK